MASTSEICSEPRSGRLFGVDLISERLLSTPLDRARGGPPLAFVQDRRNGSCPSERKWATEDTLEELWRSSGTRFGAPAVRLSGSGSGHFLLSFGALLDYRFEANRIVARLFSPDHAHLVELRFLGPVMAFWLELQGLPALHASAVVAGGRAVAFLSGNGGGKTSLACSFIQAGYPLLTDDVLAVEPEPVEPEPVEPPPVEPPSPSRGSSAAAGTFLARPSYPQMRLWPRDAERFLGSAEGLERVHPRYAKLRVPVGEGGFGTFHHESAPLGAIYLVERPGAGGAGDPGGGGPGESTAPPPRPIVEPLAPHRALIELVRHTFTPRLVEAAGLQPGRLEVLARLVERVPVRRLVVPSGSGGLEAARDAVLGDAVSTEI